MKRALAKPASKGQSEGKGNIADKHNPADKGNSRMQSKGCLQNCAECMLTQFCKVLK